MAKKRKPGYLFFPPYYEWKGEREKAQRAHPNGGEGGRKKKKDGHSPTPFEETREGKDSWLKGKRKREGGGSR